MSGAAPVDVFASVAAIISCCRRTTRTKMSAPDIDTSHPVTSAAIATPKAVGINRAATSQVADRVTDSMVSITIRALKSRHDRMPARTKFEPIATHVAPAMHTSTGVATCLLPK